MISMAFSGFLEVRKKRSEATHVMQLRKLNDGHPFEIVKNFYNSGDLAARCDRAGLDVAVRETANYFLYGTGSRR